MRLLRFLLRLLGTCPHDGAMIRVRTARGYFVQCEACGHTEPLIARTPAEIRQFKKAQMPPSQARRTQPAQVVPLQRKTR